MHTKPLTALPSGAVHHLPTPPEALLRLPDVLALTAFKRATFFDLVARGVAPAPFHIGRGSFWRYGDVLEFLRRDPTELNEALRASREKPKAIRGGPHARNS